MTSRLDTAKTKLSAFVSFADWLDGIPVEERHPSVKKARARMQI